MTREDEEDADSLTPGARGGDLRSNIQTRGTKAKAENTANELRIAEFVRPKLV